MLLLIDALKHAHLCRLGVISAIKVYLTISAVLEWPRFKNVAK